ncbi:polysaccharide biosynthesis protein [Planktomarina temperata]|nr:polysaccharide biosynthesis protein [Planktomarina temperata]
MNLLTTLNREFPLFETDLLKFDTEITEIVKSSRFLVIGGGGSIGQAVSKEIFKRAPKLLHVVDLNENYLVELVRDLRSQNYTHVSDFDTFALDCGDANFLNFMTDGKYDYVLNLSAMKHVRSEHNAYCMSRMIKVNVENTLKTYDYSAELDVKNYFCVSTDKAANPANFMGATKRAMELCLMRQNAKLSMTGARFANVAFSNGSLLEGFRHRIEKQQPLSLPLDVSRFFITQSEAGIICLFATILGKTNEILFPFNENEIRLTGFKLIAEKYLHSLGLRAVNCNSEDEAKTLIRSLDLTKYWPVHCFQSDTSGEKPFEEFYTNFEDVVHDKYQDIATIKFMSQKTDDEISSFFENIRRVDLSSKSARAQLIEIMKQFVPSFDHIDSNKFLNSRM